MDLTTLMGTIGAFLMNQSGKWKAENLYYYLANFVGSTILFIYAMFIGSYPFVVINLAWSMVSLKDVYQKIK